MVLAGRGQSIVKFGCGHTLVWFKKRAFVHVDQAVRFFSARGNNAARPVIFE